MDEKLRITQYPFPGNIRELKNIIEKAVIISTDGKLKIEINSGNLQYREQQTSMTEIDSIPESGHCYDLEENEKKLLNKVLRITNGNKIQMMKLLNITRQSLDRRLEKFNLKSSN